MEIIEKTVTSVVLKRFFCIKQKKEFIPKQLYISSIQRAEEILTKDKFIKIVKIE